MLRYGIQLTSRTIPGGALSTQLLSNPIAFPDFFANHLPRYLFYLLLSFWIHVLFTCTVLSYGFSLKYSNTKGNYSRFAIFPGIFSRGPFFPLPSFCNMDFFVPFQFETILGTDLPYSSKTPVVYFCNRIIFYILNSRL